MSFLYKTGVGGGKGGIQTTQFHWSRVDCSLSYWSTVIIILILCPLAQQKKQGGKQNAHTTRNQKKRCGESRGRHQESRRTVTTKDKMPSVSQSTKAIFFWFVFWHNRQNRALDYRAVIVRTKSRPIWQWWSCSF